MSGFSSGFTFAFFLINKHKRFLLVLFLPDTCVFFQSLSFLFFHPLDLALSQPVDNINPSFKSFRKSLREEEFFDLFWGVVHALEAGQALAI
jgi:hypothetical protein